jgi:type VI secretion system secreted protein VgrG
MPALQAASAPAALERYEYQGQYNWQKQERGDWLSRVQIEQHESQARRVHGQGGVRQLQAGRWFELTQHPLYERNAAEARQFLLIEVQFFAESNLPMAQQRREAPGSLAPLFKTVRPADTDVTYGNDNSSPSQGPSEQQRNGGDTAWAIRSGGRGKTPGYQKPLLIASSPADIATATPQNTHLQFF